MLDDLAERPTILIVDDLDINRRLLRAYLKTSDYRILEAKRAAEALLSLTKNRPGSNRPGDARSADPIFCRRIRARRYQLTPILMVTSVQGVENEIAGISSGADEFLLKPLHPTVVRTRVRAMLGIRR